MSIVAVSVAQSDENMHVTNAGPTIVATFKVIFTGTFSTAYIYQNAGAMGLVDYGDYVSGTSSVLYCSNIEAKIAPKSVFVGTTDLPGMFIYTCTFSTITAERLDLSPLSRPAVVRGGGLELTEVRRIDVNQDAMVNSAGDLYENLPDFYVPGSEFTISWNVADNPATQAQQYSFSTNEDAIWGQDAYSGLIRKITYENVYEVFQGAFIEYWRITVPITFRNDGMGWNFQPLDYGHRYNKSGGTNNPQFYTDPTTGVFGPVLLDGSGGLLNGTGTTNNADGSPGSPAVFFPAASGGDPPGYLTLTAQSWSGLSFPVSPFA